MLMSDSKLPNPCVLIPYFNIYYILYTYSYNLFIFQLQENMSLKTNTFALKS